jgi:hypothetical protein
MNIHFKLVHAVTEYDRKQSTRKHYNIYALAQYLQAIERVDSEIPAKGLRAALTGNFNGRLLDVCLKAVGLPTSTVEEQRG